MIICEKIFALFFINLTAVLLCVGCTEEHKLEDAIVIKDGLIYALSDSIPYSGLIKDTINGKIIEYEAVNGKKNGVFKTYYKNGILEMMGTIENNLNQGKWTYYYQSGQIESEGYFKDDLPTGLWKWYHENGNLREEGTFEKGNRHGKWILYDLDGNKIEEKYFRNDQPQETK